MIRSPATMATGSCAVGNRGSAASTASTAARARSCRAGGVRRVTNRRGESRRNRRPIDLQPVVLPTPCPDAIAASSLVPEG
ncbi:hypothetical protein ACTHQ1_02945 [Janibacter anophelis]|uniref:hypothetical protein n=1 Tax=Janibacter anophelis TaxID=319054 RepID=UPI003F80F49A